MLTIDPPPVRLMAGMAAWVPKKHTSGVDVHYPVPVIGRGLFQRRVVEYTCVVYQYVQPAEPADDGIHRPCPVVLAGHVERDEQSIAPLIRDLRFHRPALVLEQVGDADCGPLPGEEPRLGCPNPTGGAGDQRHLALQPHGPAAPFFLRDADSVSLRLPERKPSRSRAT